jgi:hypothetical protein
MRYFIVSLALLAGGCVFETTEPVTQSDVIWPLHIGNTWIYDSYDEEIEPNRSIDTMTVTGDTVINGVRMYMFNHDHNVLCYNDVEGAWLHSPNYHTPIIAMKYPVGVGQTFKYNDDVTMVVKSIDTLVTVEAGTFRCIKYLDEIPSHGIVTLFASPHCGRVLEYCIDGNGDTMSRSELLSFKRM